tara:strand:- start:145 stop:369 length:225 start_codon:yes stop_codon:yes gene_type:complete
MQKILILEFRCKYFSVFTLFGTIVGLDLSKKANLAIRFLSLIKGKEDIEKKSSDNLNHYVHTKDFGINVGMLIQ